MLNFKISKYNFYKNITYHANVVYIFQILSLVLSRADASFQHNTIPKAHTHQAAGQILEGSSVGTSHMAFLTSQTICIVMCSSPLVAFIFLSLLHNLMLTFEQVRKLNTPDIFQIKFNNALIVMMNNMFIFTLS